MKKPPRDEQVFAELLEGLRRDAPREMARMASLARALEHARPAAGPAPAFRTALRNRLIVEAAVRRPWLEGLRERWIERNARMRRSFRVVFANAVAAALMLAGGSILALAQEAVPGDWSYQAKRLREEARLLVTRAPVPRAYLQMDLSRERLEEVRELVNRRDPNPDHYAIALTDMDARTLDATRLLIEFFGRTADRVPLERLTRFAVAQRQGLEVLVDRLPAAARPLALDSIDSLERVAERVTGIMGGCICPANPLLPRSGPAPVAGGDGAGPGGQQEPRCACEEFRGEDEPDGSQAVGPPPPDDGSGTPGPQPSPEPSCENASGDCPIDLPELPVVGDDVDDLVNQVIDQALEPILEPLLGPSPIPTVSLGGLGGLGG